MQQQQVTYKTNFDYKALKKKSIIGDNLAEGKYCLHSCFTNVINFINSGNEIIFLTNMLENISSNGIYIETADVSIYKSISISISKKHILLNNEAIIKKQAEAYNSRLSFNDVDILVFEKNVNNIPEKYNSKFPPESMMFVLLTERCSKFITGFDVHFMKNSMEAVQYILSGKIEKGVKLLKGTGKGLTPSGDDFIAGLLWGLHFNEFKSQKDLSSLRNTIFAASIGKNPLTNAFLFNAKDGKYFYLLKNFVFLSSKKDKTEAGLNLMLSMGATSGADLLAGYIFCIKNKIGI